uniref:Matrin-type domain-containing protein n=1 Tax=Ciona savignyi TaxID=51511 RepID=H2ZIJ6_CIOSA
METSGFMGPMGPMGPFAPPMGAMPMGPGMMMGPHGPMRPHGPMGPRGPMGPMNMQGPTGPFGPGPPNMNMRPMGPMMAPGMPGMGPTRPAMMMSIYVRAYNIPDKATTEDIREYFAPILPAKIAQNIGYNIYDIDFYNPADARNALQKSGMMIRKNVVQLQLLPGPPVPLPPRPFKRKKKRSISSDNQNEDLTPHKDETAEEPVPEIEQEEEKEKIHVEPFPEDDPFKYRLPPFNPDEPAGQCAIEPMEGFYCQLCRKFYRSKSAAYSSHCKSKGHYDNVKIHVEKMKASRSENENNRSSSDIDKHDVTDFKRESSVGKKRKKD